MAYLPEQPTLKDLQHYMDEVSKERGWVKDNYAQKFLLFTEEIGELAKAIRKAEGLYEEKAKQKNIELEEEFADVLSYLLGRHPQLCVKASSKQASRDLRSPCSIHRL
jgi:NTP pyrophosphatase (non-canonical NTP hydrolase)